MHPEYAKSVARIAYIWGYPMVNMMNRRARLAQAPEPGRLGGVLPASPTGQIAMLYDYIDPGQNFIGYPVYRMERRGQYRMPDTTDHK